MAIAGGGENWDEFVAATVTRGLAGLEALSGIPGSVGATPVQNVGAYGQEIRQTMAWAWVFNLETRQWQLFENEACEFSYRNSRFKEAGRGVYFIAEVAFRLQKKGAPAIQYKDLREYLAKAGLSQPSLEEARNAVLTIRKRKGMVTDPADQDTCSCGSFFKNPIVSLEVVGEVIHRLKARGMAEAEQIMPRYPERDGRVKLSAAWLIERSGIRPGFKMGKAAVSSKHVLALTNTGGATAADMQTLAAHVQTVVFDAVGLTLEPEPDFLGFD